MSVKSKKAKKVEEDEEEDHGFLMALIDDPVGRRVLICLSLLLLTLPSYALGKEFFWVMLLALALTSVLTFLILDKACGVDVKSYVKALFYGSLKNKKD